MDGQTLYSEMLQYARQLKEQNVSHQDAFSNLTTKYAEDLAVQDYPAMLAAYKFVWDRFKPSPSLVAVTVTYEVYVFPPKSMAALLITDHNCTETAAILRVVYQISDPSEMAEILIVGARCSVEDASDAVETVYGMPPIIPHREPQNYTFEVVAGAKWQETPATIQADEVATITYQSGYWNISPATGLITAAGSSRYIAKAGYMLPGVNEGMLVGLVDGTVFAVGTSGNTPPEKTGVLYLATNDDEIPLYGRGYYDNSGSIIVNIAVNPRS